MHRLQNTRVAFHYSLGCAATLYDIALDDADKPFVQRDVVERGRTAEAVMERYTRILKPMHQQFIEPCKRYADLIVPEGGNNQVAIDILTMYIKKHL